jgi:hypothetical protein
MNRHMHTISIPMKIRQRKSNFGAQRDTPSALSQYLLMHPKQLICPCCGQVDFFEVATFVDNPVSGVLRCSTSELLPSREFVVDACESCGLLRNRQFLAPPDYSGKPRATARQLPAYHNRLLGLIADVANKDDLIAEVGSNDGTFLDLLRDQGYTNIYGAEPSGELVKRAREKGHRVVAEYFDSDIVEALHTNFGVPKLVICRHTLEHVPNPGAFVQALRMLLASGKGSALVEVPDSTAIPEGVNFVELWDEHLFYFTPFTLQLLMERYGLKVVSEMVLPHLETRNILIHVTADGCSIDPENEAVSSGEVEMWSSFSERFRALSVRIRNATLAAPKPIYLMGASHPQCNFVNYLGLAPLVDFMIDDDPVKVGKLPPIDSDFVRVIASDEFSQQPPGGTLLLTAFGYANWTRQLSEVALSKAMTIIDPRSYA